MTLDKSTRAGSDAVVWLPAQAEDLKVPSTSSGAPITLPHEPWRTRTLPLWVQPCAEAYLKS